MSENNQTEVKSSFSYTIETKEYPRELIKILKEKNIPFKATKYRELIQGPNDIDEELPLIEVDPEIYQKLKKVSEITGISIKDMASNEIKHLLTDFIPAEPFIFLDIFLGIENVEKPFEIIEQLKEIVNFGDKHYEALKTMDPVKYVEEWNTGHIKPNN